MTDVIRAIVQDVDEITPCSIIPNGAYGLSGISIGLPVRLGSSGVACVEIIDLSDEEQTALAAAARKIRAMTESALRGVRT
jgi:malate dehydrogenase